MKQVHGVMLCEQGQNTDIYTSIVHDAPESTSRQQQRMIVGKSCVSINHKITSFNIKTFD
jgi:Fe-S cluster assembly scaffold protein SufB